MMMVDTYSSLPHLRYQGNYPSSMVSPQETGKDTPQQNGTNDEEAKVETPKNIVDIDTTVKKESQSEEIGEDISPTPKASVPPQSSPHKRSVSPVRADRGQRSSRIIDSYRPSSPNRKPSKPREKSRSRSRGHRPIDRYSSSNLRRSNSKTDSYIPPPRKRSIDEDSTQGREKRKRNSSSEEREMSEGEVR
jgi:hypothetical protein